MLCILTCKNYRIEASNLPSMEAAIKACGDLERASNDGYARVVSEDGVMVADADGEWSYEGRGGDAATATGMYDRGDF